MHFRAKNECFSVEKDEFIKKYVFFKIKLDFLLVYVIIIFAHTIYCVVNILKFAYFGGKVK